MTRRLRRWMRCPTCGGRFGRHDQSDFGGPPWWLAVRRPRWLRDRVDVAWWRRHEVRQDRGTSG